MKTTQSDIIHCFLFPSRQIMLTNTLGEVKGGNSVLFEGYRGLNIKTKTGTASKHLEKSISTSQTPINSTHKNISCEGQGLARIAIKETGVIFSYISRGLDVPYSRYICNYLETCPNYTDLLVKIMIV